MLTLRHGFCSPDAGVRVVALMQACFESSMYIVAVLWAPVLSDMTPYLSLGLLFAHLMLCNMLGGLAFQVLSNRGVSVVFLLRVALALSTASLVLVSVVIQLAYLVRVAAVCMHARTLELSVRAVSRRLGSPAPCFLCASCMLCVRVRVRVRRAMVGTVVDVWTMDVPHVAEAHVCRHGGMSQCLRGVLWPVLPQHWYHPWPCYSEPRSCIRHQFVSCGSQRVGHHTACHGALCVRTESSERLWLCVVVCACLHACACAVCCNLFVLFVFVFVTCMLTWRYLLVLGCW